MSNNCETSCNLAVALLGLLVIIFALRYYYMNKPHSVGKSMEESFANHQLSHSHQNPEVYQPCSPENFKKSLYEFYKSAESYRSKEKDLKDAQLNYEQKYDEFHKQQQNLNFHKNRIGQCIDR